MELVCIDSGRIRRCFPFDENTTTTPEAIGDRLWGGLSFPRKSSDIIEKLCKFV